MGEQGSEKTPIEVFFGKGIGKVIGVVLAFLTAMAVFLDDLIKILSHAPVIFPFNYSYITLWRLRWILFIVGLLILLRVVFTEPKPRRLFKAFQFVVVLVFVVVFVWGGTETYLDPRVFRKAGLPEDIAWFAAKKLTIHGPTHDLNAKSAGKGSEDKKGTKTVGRERQKPKAVSHVVSSLRFVNEEVSSLVLKDLYFDHAVQIPAQIKDLTLVNCSGFKSLHFLNLEGRQLRSLWIESCPDLESLAGLERIHSKSRGSLSRVTLRHNTALKSIDALGNFENINTLEIAGGKAISRWRVLGKLTSLETLVLEDVPKDPAKEKSGAESPPKLVLDFSISKTLRRLTLIDTDIHSFEAFKSAVHLQTLEVSYNPLLGFGNMEPMSDPPKINPMPFSELTSVSWNGPISQEGLDLLLGACSRVTTLELGELEIPLDARLIKNKVPLCRELRLKGLQAVHHQDALSDLFLQRLSLFNVPSKLFAKPPNIQGGPLHSWASGRVFAELEQLEVKKLYDSKMKLSFARFPKLKRLKLEGVQNMIDWTSICPKNPEQLRRISLVKCPAFSDLTYLARFEKLTHLYLESDKGYLENLEQVNLGSVEVLSARGRVSLGDLRYLEKAPKLKSLQLSSHPSLYEINLPKIPLLEELSISHYKRLRHIDLGENPQIVNVDIHANHDEEIDITGTGQLNKVGRLALPTNLKKQRLGYYFKPKQVNALDSLTVRLRNEVP